MKTLRALNAAARQARAPIGGKKGANLTPLNGYDWKVLSVIVDQTLAYSRLSDRISAVQISALAGIDIRDAYRSLSRLQAANLVDRISKGRDTAITGPTFGLMIDQRALEQSEVGRVTHGDTGSRDPDCREASSEKLNPACPEEKYDKNFSRTLFPLRPSKEYRPRLYAAWQENPEGFKECVEKCCRRATRSSDGLLLRMIQDGDHRRTKRRRRVQPKARRAPTEREREFLAKW